MLCPPHHDSANAVGAAIAKVAGEVDVIEILAGKDEEAVYESIKQKAVDTAVMKGADPKDVQVVEIKKIPQQYITNKTTRVVVKAVGSLDISRATKLTPAGDVSEEHDIEMNGCPPEAAKAEVSQADTGSMARPTVGVDLEKYRPEVRDGVWHISAVDVELLASGQVSWVQGVVDHLTSCPFMCLTCYGKAARSR